MTRSLIIAVCAIFFSGYVSQNTSAASYPSVSQAKLSRLIAQPTITTIYRSTIGFLWVGTQQGLYRFDGATYTFFGSGNQEKYIPASSISGIGEDLEGNLWVSTFGGGLLKLDRALDQFKTISIGNKLEEKFLTDMIVSAGRYLWLASNKGVIAYDSVLSRAAPWFKRHELSKKIGKPYTILEDRSGAVFIASRTGLYIALPLEEKLERVDPLDLDLEPAEHISIGKADGSYIFLGTNTGRLIKFDIVTRSIEAKSKRSDRISGTISSLEIHEGKVWIGSYGGLWSSDKELNSIRPASSTNPQLSNQHIVSLYSDLDGVWVGTYQGLDRLAFPQFQTLNRLNSGISNDVLAFEQDSDGRLWIGTYDGLFILERPKSRHRRIETLKDGSSLQGQQIMALSRNKNEIWIGFRQGGLRIIDTKKFSSRIPDILNIENFAITQILHAPNGKTWVGTHDGGIFRMDSNSSGDQSFDRFLSNQPVKILFETLSADILAATGNGLFRFEDNKNGFREIKLVFDHPQSLHYILSINQSKNGDLWLGTKDHGLFIWTQESQKNDVLKVSQVAAGTQLSSSTVYAIEFDDRGNLWCSTQQGLIQLHGDRVTLSSFKLSDGLQGNDFNFSSSFVGSTGDLYFGGVNGYNRFAPDHIAPNLSPPKLLLRTINVSGQNIRPNYSLKNQENIKLPHNNYFISFEFSVLDFLDPEKNQYRYMLDGFDPDWVENGNRNTATYTNLPAGNYTFRVQGANSAGVWNREGIAVQVVVMPAPWFTWWAFCLYSIPLIAAFLLYRKMYGDNLRKKQAIQAAKDNQLIADRAQDDLLEQQDLQDRLVQSIYQHNLSTLATVQTIMNRYSDARGSLPEARPRDENGLHIQALSVLEGCLYQQDDNLVADLNKYTNLILDLLLEEAPFPRESLITINDVTKTHIPAELAKVLAIAILELLENSIQHAFIGRRPGHIIHIQLCAEPEKHFIPDLYKLSVQDNGIGLPAGFDLSTADTPGFGLLSDLATSYGGSLDAVSSEGTTLVFSIPTAMTRPKGELPQ